MDATGPSLLRMRGIEKHFGPVRALSGVDLDVASGEVHALIGENGAGKSTLMKVLSGAHRPDSGEMELGGQPYTPEGPLDARRQGVAMIYQDLALAPHLTVEQNITLGREPSKAGVVDRGAQRASVERALRWLDEPGLTPDRPVMALPPGPRQLVEVARALAGDSRVVVMDEPTSSLSKRETRRLFEVIDRLRERGVSVIYISHFLEEVRQVADRYTVLRDGRTVESGTVPKGDGDEAAFIRHVIEAMAGRSLESAFPHVPHTPGEVVLELDGLSGARLPDRASLTLRHGEILGLAGLVGAGRTELLRALFGLDPIRAGRVTIGGDVDAGRDPADRLAQGVGLLSEDRTGEGLALNMSIADNLTLSKPTARFGVISRTAQRRATAETTATLALKHRDATQAVGELSGGNQQKVALARLLHHDVDILLFDEPTRGIDVGTKAEIYRLMGQLARQGKAILFVSSYLPELLGVCDRIAVMSRGRLGPARPVAEWTEAALLESATAADYA
ncbi:MAG: sugar ABC transporter ATP-binding protein [Acidobacteria bacterium]|nr:sugar ABC transporter ATP-binding protein [Acidobacteriota bacterium]